MDSTNNIQIVENRWLSFWKSIFVFILVATFLITPFISHANVLSFIGEMFSGQEVSAETETIIESNSQTMPLLVAANTPNPTARIASDITVVDDEALLAEVGPSNTEPEKANVSSDQISIYIVRSGDNLAKIAEMFDVSVNTILWANDLAKGSALKAGQSLVILPMSGVLHTVVKGDTLNTIAKKYTGNVEEIALFNDLKVSDKLLVGQTVMIPDGQVSSSIRPSTASNHGATPLIKGTDKAPDYGGYYQKPFVGGTKTQGLHGYNAVDYGLPVGTQLYAAAAGEVIISKSAGWNGGYGVYVVIKHPNNTQTVYGHMSKTVVSVGQTVTKGQLIGYSGNTGNSTGPHLHFEIRGAKNPF
ncbi:MAG: peptidoglycan DD-metalloendopeptidase family protein [Candidatus Paceibacterota bacterium]